MLTEQEVVALNERIDQLEGEIEGLCQDYSALSEKVENQEEAFVKLMDMVSEGFNRIGERFRDLER